MIYTSCPAGHLYAEVGTEARFLGQSPRGREVVEKPPCWFICLGTSALLPPSGLPPCLLFSFSSPLFFCLDGSKAPLTGLLRLLLPDIQSDNPFRFASTGGLAIFLQLQWPFSPQIHLCLHFSHSPMNSLSNSSTLHWFPTRCFSLTYCFLPASFLF